MKTLAWVAGVVAALTGAAAAAVWAFNAGLAAGVEEAREEALRVAVNLSDEQVRSLVAHLGLVPEQNDYGMRPEDVEAWNGAVLALRADLQHRARLDFEAGDGSSWA